VTVDLDPSIPGVQITLVVAGEGSWVYIPSTGMLTFSPYAGFTTDPTPITYTLTEIETSLSDPAIVSVGYLRYPDLTPNITAEPNIMHGITSFSIIVKVTELNMISSNGTITVLVPKDTRWSFTFNQSATTIGANPVSNSVWSHSSDAIYDIFTTTSVIPAGGFSQFGFSAVWNAGFTMGTYTMTSQIVSWSGGENRIDNNVDAEKLDYFIY
jgi:hypothetical protein